MVEVNFGHMGAKLCKNRYFVRKYKRGLTLRPSTKCNGDHYFEFLIREKSNSGYFK